MSDELDMEDLIESEEYCLGYQQGKADAIEKFVKIIAMDIADCSKCPLDCEVNTYGGCEEMLKTYVLEQLKENNE